MDSFKDKNGKTVLIIYDDNTEKKDLKHFEDKKKCKCIYSRSMDQVYPRKCVKCGVPEIPKEALNETD